jgi:hypothetical protein
LNVAAYDRFCRRRQRALLVAGLILVVIGVLYFAGVFS